MVEENIGKTPANAGNAYGDPVSSFWVGNDTIADVGAAQVNLSSEAETTDGLIREAVAAASELCRYDIRGLQDSRAVTRLMKYVFNYADTLGNVLNGLRGKTRHIPLARQVMSLEIAVRIIAGTGDIALLVNDGSKKPRPVLAYYSRTGPMAGVWTEIGDDDAGVIGRILADFGVPASGLKKGYLDYLKRVVPVEHYRVDPHIYPLADGLVVFQDGQRFFVPYLGDDGNPDPTYEALYGRDAHIVGKSAARYCPGMPAPKFECEDGFEWDPLTHLHESTGNNDAAVTVILQSILFGIRGLPGGYNFWAMDGSKNKSGGGGKSTTLHIIESALGGLAVSLNLEQLAGKDFYLGMTVGKRMISGDETKAGQKQIEGSDILKLLGRNEPYIINNKYQAPYEYAFQGIWYQCMNTEAPKFLEREDALYRTVVPLYFPMSYTKSAARKIIGDQYARSQSVADWVVNYALDRCGDTLAYDPEAIRVLRAKISDIRASGSSVYSFLDEYLAESHNDDLPLGLLYRFYARYARTNNFFEVNLKTFKNDAAGWANMRGGWRVEDHPNAVQKKYAWMVDRWATDNLVDGLTFVEPGGRVKLSDTVLKWRDRDWLVRDGSRQHVPSSGPDPLSILSEDAAYAAYRASVAAFAAEHPDLAAGLAPSGLYLSRDHWERLCRPAPAWLVPGTAPGAEGWVISAGDGVTEYGISPEGYARAMAAGNVDVAIKFDLQRFVAAATES